MGHGRVVLEEGGIQGSLGGRHSSCSPSPPQGLHLEAHCVFQARQGGQRDRHCRLASYSSQSPGIRGRSPPSPASPPGPAPRTLSPSVEHTLKSCGRGQGLGCWGGPNNKSHHRPQVLPGPIFLSACFELSPWQLQHLLGPGNLGVLWGLGTDRLSCWPYPLHGERSPSPHRACHPLPWVPPHLYIPNTASDPLPGSDVLPRESIWAPERKE